VIHTEDKVVLRDADREECFLGGWTPEAALRFSIENSTLSFRIDRGGETLCYWGFRAGSILSADCRAWMLSTPAIEDHKIFAARKSRIFLSELLEDFYSVTVLVDPNYTLSIQWLRWLGFSTFKVLDRFVEMRVTRGSRA
jgi:hypothetical protein